MKIIKHPVFLSYIIVATSIYLGQLYEVHFPRWVYSYLNDFLCMPIVLSFCLLIIRVIKKNESLYVPMSVVLALTIYFTIFFEFLMPQISERYTKDFVDGSLYFLGALLFYIFQKRLF